MYQAALVLGPSTVLRIAREAGTERTTTYTLVENLVRRGLMRKEEVGLKARYVAEDPERLRLVAERTLDTASVVIPELVALHKRAGTRLPIRVYEGLEALRQVSDEVARTTKRGDFRYYIGGALGWKDVDPAWHKRYLKWRSRIHVDARFIFQDSERARMHAALAPSLRQHVRVVRPDAALQADILVTPRRVVISRLSHPAVAVVIDDREIVRTYEGLFGLLWGTAQPVGEY